MKKLPYGMKKNSTENRYIVFNICNSS